MLAFIGLSFFGVAVVVSLVLISGWAAALVSEAVGAPSLARQVASAAAGFITPLVLVYTAHLLTEEPSDDDD